MGVEIGLSELLTDKPLGAPPTAAMNYNLGRVRVCDLVENPFESSRRAHRGTETTHKQRTHVCNVMYMQ